MERQEYELEAVDMGNLFHQSIDRCFAVMKEENRNWRTLSEEDRKQLVKECVRQVTQEYGNTIMGSTARNAYLTGRVERMTDRTIWALAEQLKKGEFEPAGFEVSFSAADDLKAMRIRPVSYTHLDVYKRQIEGDANGRGFQYPIPTYSITSDFDWSDTENNRLLFEMTSKYGTPYFSNYINSDMKPVSYTHLNVISE